MKRLSSSSSSSDIHQIFLCLLLAFTRVSFFPLDDRDGHGLSLAMKGEQT